MRKTVLLLISMIFSMVWFAPTLHAKKQKEGGQTIIFGIEERRIITDYFRVNTNNLPPGLAKRNGNLPPGLQKHLRRRGQLPPGLQKRVEPFPLDLERRLPRLPPIYRRGVLDNRAIIYDSNTMAIMDIIQILTGSVRR